MAELHCQLPRERGFTLVEMLAALGILLFGITALLGALSSSVGQRRTTDARLAAAALCEEALFRIQAEAVRPRAGGETELDLELATLEGQTAPGFPGMSWSAKVVTDDDRPELWLVRLSVHWLEAGEETGEEFLRVVPRQMPLAERVRRRREAALANTTR